jgi:hypothetical protein
MRNTELEMNEARKVISIPPTAPQCSTAKSAHHGLQAY